MPNKPATSKPSAIAGSRPYEMVNRTEDRVPLFGFESISGWRVEGANGAKAELVRSRERQMWGSYVGKLTYWTSPQPSPEGEGEGTTSPNPSLVRRGEGKGAVTLRPPAPIPIPDAFDCINMWIFGNLWEWDPDPGTPFVDISVLIVDSSNTEHKVPLVRVRWKEWWLTHKKLDKLMDHAGFAGLVIDGVSNQEPRTIFLDSIYFYKEDLKPLTFKPRPARNLTPLAGQSQGLNGTGRGKLPFPTREQTILPTNLTPKFANSVRKSGSRYEFAYDGEDCRVAYAYEPSTGSLGEISAYVNGKKVSTPMSGGGLQFGEGAAVGTLTNAVLKNDELHLTFDLGKPAHRAEYVMWIWQKSLVVDFICRGGNATGLSFGEIHEAESPRLVLIPYLTLGGSNPRVLCSGKPDDPMFTSIWADWYRSNGSEPWSEEWAKGNSAKINGGVRYIPKTDGKRNDLYERVFLTVSPTFEETLPTIANPPSPRGKIAGERLWQESWGPGDYAKETQRSIVLRSYGIDMLTRCNHEITWRDGGESFTLRTKAAPGRGGDEALRNYVSDQKSLGWLSGLYTNYTDFAPVNEHWNEDYVQLTPEGEWRPAWPRNYALKPSRAVELDAELAHQVQAKFGSNAAYTDVHTAASPWYYCDYDARVPGAGTFAATFYAYGELLLNDQKVYGPIWSEGTFQWLYAGLATGNYGLAYTGVDLAKEPLNVAFDLMKIHPLECDIGMPWTSKFLQEPGWDKPENIDASIDHLLAATIAYGHIGWLVEEHYGIERTCRSYYMHQQLQKRYAMQRPAKIEYADGGSRLMSVSQAIATDTIKDSRLHIHYRNGLQVWVNGSRENWAVDGITLPPWGWYARTRDGSFVEFSAIANGHRADYAKSPDYEYIDGRGVLTTIGGLSAKGAFALRREGEHFEVIDVYGNDEIGVKVSSAGKCTAYDGEGKSLGPVKIRYEGDIAVLKTVKGARKYVWR